LNTSPDGKLTVISGPSGVGKSTIVDAILDATASHFSVSATTRPARAGEVDDVDYFFVDDQAFDAMIASGEILEWAAYGGNRYGTLRSAVLPILGTGRNVVLDIENEGAKQIRASFPEALLIFVSPPDLGTLEDRLAGRGDTSKSDIDLRLAVAAIQIAEAPEVYDHVVVNKDLDRAIDEVLDILRAEGTDVAVH
jgi:guanylate kinase